MFIFQQILACNQQGGFSSLSSNVRTREKLCSIYNMDMNQPSVTAHHCASVLSEITQMSHTACSI